MSEGDLIGLVARRGDGSELGRVVEVITSAHGGELTHVVVEWEGQYSEVPVSEVTLDTGTGTERGGERAPVGEDEPHSGQFVAEPESPAEAGDQEAVEREDWEDESYTPADSGYPRTDAFIDPDTGEERERYPEAEGQTTAAAVAELLEGTGLEVLEVVDGMVRLGGYVAAHEDLRRAIRELMGISEVREVDATEVDVG